MSMFENKTKPELEAGNYIAYTDEPNTVVDNAGGGGGVVVYLDAEYDVESDTPSYIAKFSYNDVKNSVEAGNFVCLRTVYTDPGSGTGIFEMRPVSGMQEESDPVGYSVFAERLIFTADAPDIPMTYDDE